MCVISGSALISPVIRARALRLPLPLVMRSSPPPLPRLSHASSKSHTHFPRACHALSPRSHPYFPTCCAEPSEGWPSIALSPCVARATPSQGYQRPPPPALSTPALPYTVTHPVPPGSLFTSLPAGSVSPPVPSWSPLGQPRPRVLRPLSASPEPPTPIRPASALVPFHHNSAASTTLEDRLV